MIKREIAFWGIRKDWHKVMWQIKGSAFGDRNDQRNGQHMVIGQIRGETDTSTQQSERWGGESAQYFIIGVTRGWGQKWAQTKTEKKLELGDRIDPERDQGNNQKRVRDQIRGSEKTPALIIGPG